MKATLTGLLQKLSKHDLAVLIGAATGASASVNIIPGALTIGGLPVNILTASMIITIALAFVSRKFA